MYQGGVQCERRQAGGTLSLPPMILQVSPFTAVLARIDGHMLVGRRGTATVVGALKLYETLRPGSIPSISHTSLIISTYLAYSSLALFLDKSILSRVDLRVFAWPAFGVIAKEGARLCYPSFARPASALFSSQPLFQGQLNARSTFRTYRAIGEWTRGILNGSSGTFVYQSC